MVTKETKGITIVSLVVTIVVLLILASVTVNVLFGDNGVVKNVSARQYTAYENIALPVVLDNQDVDEEEINDLLDALQVEHCRDKFPEQMSGGEQQRVAIARALIMHPAVVYADEPTGNLDAESAENVAAMLSLAAAKYRQTIVMVTHDKQMAEYADRILSIVDGHVISDVTE